MRKYPKRIRKMRASRVCGYGTQGQHRKAGQRAGKGKTTQWKGSKRSYYLKQKELGFPDPDWIMGKTGFKRPQDIVRIYKVNSMNIKDLDLNIDTLVEKNKAKKSGNTYSIDLNDINIQKLLGSGELKKKMNITVNKASKQAIEKIKSSGSKITLLSEAQ